MKPVFEEVKTKNLNQESPHTTPYARTRKNIKIAAFFFESAKISMHVPLNCERTQFPFIEEFSYLKLVINCIFVKTSFLEKDFLIFCMCVCTYGSLRPFIENKKEWTG